MDPIQLHRHIAFNSPFGQDVLLLTQIRGQEGVSRLFQFDLELVSLDPSLDMNGILGKNVSLRIRQVDGSDRYFNGVVSRFTVAGVTENYSTYHVEMVPWLWLLSKTSDCKIFQFMTPPEIISMVFDTYGFGDYQLRLSGSYPTREYVVQYRETDFNFVSRLMEQYGIFYFFEHADGVHTLVLADSNAEFKPCPNQARARYQRTHEATVHDEDVITAWMMEHDFRTAKVSLMDFNFKTPAVNLQVNQESGQPAPGGMPFEHYDYPGNYDVTDVGDALAKVGVQEEDGQIARVTGGSNCRPFTSGFSFALYDHPRGDLNQTYVLTEVQHLAREGTYESGDEAGGFTYSNQIAAIPIDFNYRPPRVTPRPVISGLQTAIVAGPEEIWTDEYGRIKVQFHWDRIHGRDDDSSCWIRVAQTWAGKQWGSVFIPRVGQEVLVAFLEGDPDQPMVVGAVFNGDQVQPYPLPDFKTRSVLRTDTTTGGGDCHEFRLEDKAGMEEIFVHSSGELNMHVLTNRHETVEGEKHLEVYKDQIESLGANRYAKVAGADVASVGGDLSKRVGGNLVLKVDSSHTEDVGQEIYLKAGMKVVIEAGLELTLKAAGGFVKIDPMGVTIQGTMVLINSGGAAGTGTMQSPTSVKTPKKVDPPDVGSPDFNIFMPTNAVDPGNATGSTSVGPGEPDGE
jgi:type VI secretion system secreted protein VgrG